MINSPFFGFKNEITHVKQALVSLGEKEVRKWVTLVTLQNMSTDKPDEILRVSMIRARFAELIARLIGKKEYSDELFLTGLFSMLDVIMNQPLESILNEISITHRIADGLLNPTTLYYTIMQLILASEKGDWNKLNDFSNILNIDSSKVSDAYIKALLWYNDVELANY